MTEDTEQDHFASEQAYTIFRSEGASLKKQLESLAYLLDHPLPEPPEESLDEIWKHLWNEIRMTKNLRNVPEDLDLDDVINLLKIDGRNTLDDDIRLAFSHFHWIIAIVKRNNTTLSDLIDQHVDDVDILAGIINTVNQWYEKEDRISQMVQSSKPRDEKGDYFKNILITWSRERKDTQDGHNGCP